jgi:hypothetical protein
MKERSILDVFHPNAKDLFIVSSDLKKVCWELWDPEKTKAVSCLHEVPFLTIKAGSHLFACSSLALFRRTRSGLGSSVPSSP